MNITIKKEAVLEPLKNIVNVSEQRQTMPILGHVLMSVKGGVCTLTSTDLEVQISHEDEGIFDSDFKVTVPARKFFDIIKSLEAAEIDLEINDSDVVIKSGKSRFKVSSLSSDDFPLMESDNSSLINLDSEELLKLINSTSFSMGYQDARHFLNGLFLQFTDNKIISVATDGHRLAYSCTHCESDTRDSSCIIPRKCVLEIRRILSSFKDFSQIISSISINNMNLLVKIGNYTIISKLIEGNYPDYNKVFPQNLSNLMTIDRPSLKASLQRLAIMSSDQYKGVKLTLSKDLLNLSTINSENESGDESLECQYSGDSLEIGFNLSYLIETLDVIETPNIAIHLGSSDSGCLVTAENNESSKYIIMPMRV